MVRSRRLMLSKGSQTRAKQLTIALAFEYTMLTPSSSSITY